MSDPAARLAYEHARALAARDAAHRALTERLLLRCADALDAFDRLLADGAASDVETYRGSLTLIARQLERDLAEEGLERVGLVGERAEPATHHIADVRPTPPGGHGDEVLQVLRRGYRYRGQLLRAARVVVAVDEGPEPGPGPEGAGGGAEQGTERE